MSATVALIDYGSGNLRSAEKALARAASDGGTGHEILVTSDANVVAEAERVVLPGVGAFADCMKGVSSIPHMIDALRDKVLNKEGKTIGVSTWVGYSSNEGKMLTLAILDNAYTQPGEQVTFVWGENPVTSKTTVEPHTQMQIRATVCPVPYATVAREAYRTT